MKKTKTYFTHQLKSIVKKSKLNLIQQDKRIETVTRISKDTTDIARLILDNKIYFSKSMDVIDFKSGIDWDYKHYKNKNSYQMHLHALRPISYLVNSFEVNNDIKYLKKAKAILDDWLKYEETNHENMFVWYDHSVADRTRTIMYFYLIAKKHFFLKNDVEILKLIERHADHLMDDKNYRKNNHGMMMDKALIMLGLVFDVNKTKGYTQKGLQRLRNCFQHSFSFKGVHLENSPEYHVYVHKMLLSIEKYLNNNRLSLGKCVMKKFDLIDDYYRYITKPNGYLPMIGDSTNMKSPKNVVKKYDSFYDQAAGIAILQSENLQNPSKSTWLSFICGFGTLTHKHYDDLSFTLVYKGEDIFVDSGGYGYGRSPERNYMLSPLAHNTITVAGRKRYVQSVEYEKNKIASLASSSDEIAITAFKDNVVYSYVKGINAGYENIQIERSILFIKPDILIVIDKAFSMNNKKYTFLQNFNLDPCVIVNRIDKDEAELQSGESKIIVKQNFSVNDAKLIIANREQPRAVISKKAGQLTDTNQIEFSKTGKKVYFMTTILLGEGLERNVSVKCDNNKNILNVTLNGDSIDVVI